MIDGLAFTAASVPGPPELRRQMGSIIECSVDKLRPPHWQISAGWGDARGGGGGSTPSVHLAPESSSGEGSTALTPASHLITDNQDLRAAGDLSIYLVFQSLNSINNLCKGGVVKQKETSLCDRSFEFGSAARPWAKSVTRAGK